MFRVREKKEQCLTHSGQGFLSLGFAPGFKQANMWVVGTNPPPPKRSRFRALRLRLQRYLLVLRGYNSSYMIRTYTPIMVPIFTSPLPLSTSCFGSGFQALKWP